MSHKAKSLFVAIVILFLPGCTDPQIIEDENVEVPDTLPEYLNLEAETAGREIDRGQTINILEDANGQNTLLLWVSTGCTGCHDWTEVIAEEMRNGNISNDTRIITVHRYPSFESKEEVISVYASENESTESLWPVVIPNEGQPAIDVEMDQETEYDYAKAFGKPATPSLTILDGDGKTIWKNKTYWANQSVLDEALEYL